MKLTHNFQDNLLLRDIIQRNYFNNFDYNKSFNLTFFYNDLYTNYMYIPTYESYQSLNNFNSILKNFELFLEWYKYNNFNTKIIIHDNFLLNNKEYVKKILKLIVDSNINYKNLNIVIDLIEIDNIAEVIDTLKSLKINNLTLEFNVNLEDSKKIQEFNLNSYGIINILIHPQIGSEELIDNYNFIIQNKYNIQEYIDIDSDKWDEINIQNYLQFIKYLLLKNDFSLLYTSSPININDQHVIDNTYCKKNCCFQNSLNILIVDLSINLCHKFQYDDQIIGYLKPNEETILAFESKILPLIMLNTHLKRSSTPHCEICPYINICKGFCFASSYKKCFNPAIPIEESCNLKKAKFSLIFSYLSKLKEFEIYIKNSNFSQIYKENILQILFQFKKEE